MRVTKQFKVDQYETLTKRNDLLSYYLWDKEDGKKPDAVVKQGEWTVTAYRLTGANGGYVVLRPKNGVPDIAYLDAISEHYANDAHPNTLDLRICLERVRMERNKTFQQSA